MPTENKVAPACVIIRDPDYENDVTYYGIDDIHEFSLDVGAQWASGKDFQWSLRDNEPDAIGYCWNLLDEIEETVGKDHPAYDDMMSALNSYGFDTTRHKRDGE